MAKKEMKMPPSCPGGTGVITRVSTAGIPIEPALSYLRQGRIHYCKKWSSV